MRLTLRTMLAYLDDILEPDDAADIQRKIEESEFATRLVHRLRDCTGRARLSAPAVLGRGMGLDPNTVAEYLDNTLTSERVAQFEKVCLESDVHLAEVAASHQILTLVLGEPAAIDPAGRERMYKLIAERDVPEPATAEVVASEQPPVLRQPPSMPALPHRRPTEIPAYLRESKSRLWPVAATLLVTALLTVFVLAALATYGPTGVRSLVANWSGSGETPKEPPAAQPAPAELPGKSPLQQPASVKPAPVPTSPVEPPAQEPPQPVVAKAPPEPPTQPIAPPTSPAVVPPVPTGTAVAPPAPTNGSRPGPATTPHDLAAHVLGNPSQPAGASGLPGSEAPRAAPKAPVGVEALGRYLSEHEVLLKFDRTSKRWVRLETTAPLSVGDQLFALPTFRPTITLRTGLSLTLLGPSLAVLEAADQEEVPQIAVRSGRVLMFTVGKPNNRLRVRIGDDRAVLNFIDPAATAGLDVRMLLKPGQDPTATPATPAAELYATRGEISWQANTTSVLQGPAHKLLTAAAIAESPPQGLPRWLTGDTLSPAEQRGATVLEHDLQVDRPVELSLKELTDNKRIEVQSLAVRSAAYIGQFEPIVASLSDPDQRALWSNYVDVLHQVMAQGPEACLELRKTLEKLRGPEGAEIYELLCGYNAEQLQQGAAAKLVAGLSHDALDIRVLSFLNLQSITGMSLYYRAEYPAAKRQPMIQKWTEKLRQGKIIPPAGSN